MEGWLGSRRRALAKALFARAIWPVAGASSAAANMVFYDLFDAAQSWLIGWVDRQHLVVQILCATGLGQADVLAVQSIECRVLKFDEH